MVAKGAANKIFACGHLYNLKDITYLHSPNSGVRSAQEMLHEFQVSDVAVIVMVLVVVGCLVAINFSVKSSGKA